MPRNLSQPGKARSIGGEHTKSRQKGRRPPQSKKRAAERSQNAFKLTQSDDDSDSQAEVKSEDDEEIDSDEAFESGDEDKFGSFKFSGSDFLKKQRRKAAVNHPKASRQEGPREIDLKEDSDADNQSLASSQPVGRRASISNAEMMDEDEEESQSDFENDDGDDLMDLSEMLNNTRRASTASGSSSEADGDAGIASASQNSDLAESGDTDDGDDSDSSADASEVSASDDESQQDALERFVDQLQQKRKREDGPVLESSPDQKTKKRNRVTEDNEQIPESEHNLLLSSSQGKLNLDTMLDSLSSGNAKVLRKTQALQAPLAKPIQDRLNRSAAYDTVKEQITKWQPAVRQMREARVLKFPLNEVAHTQANNNSLAATFKPSNDLENHISEILKNSGMQSEKNIAKFEDLEMAKLSTEEVQRRRAELAIMRDLLFRQEQKAKRQSKIKSKAYRRVHRKEKEKARLALQAEEPIDAIETAQQAESIRARERMELRHKNTGKWAQKMLTRADHGEGSRAAITEQLQRGEALERKMRGIEDESGDESLEEEHGTTSVDEPLPDKGVFSMKFMRDADARQADMVAALNDDGHSIGSEDSDREIGGRRSYKPATSSVAQSKQDTRHQRDARKTTADFEPQKSSQRPDEQDRLEKEPSTEDYNPWLSNEPIKRQSRSAVIAKDSDEGLKFAAKLQKQKKKSVPVHAGRMNKPILDVNRILPMKASSPDLNPEADEGGQASQGDRIVMKQLDLVSQAFAGDNVVAEFQAAKDTTVAEDAPQDIDETLPGWGSWVGDGVKKSRKSKKFIKHIDGINVEQRKDAKLQHVIINEKRMKQAKPFMSQSVPFPFETKEQYERSLNLPIGPEFTTRTNFQKNIMPHVVKKQGKVVAPMEKPFKD